MKRKVTVGTRGSKLALVQTEIAIKALRSYYPDCDFQIKVIRTSGDNLWDRPLYEMEGKGFFIKEIEEALLSGEIDIAIHSMKDVPSEVTKGLKIAAILKRDDPRDAFVSFEYENLDKLPPDSRVGTSSLRRRIQIMNLRNDIEVVPIRGNVETRLKKIKSQNLDGVILAYCGLKRLGLESYVSSVIPLDIIVPPAGQGAIGIEVRENSEFFEMVKKVNDEKTAREVELERRIQTLAGGGCRFPLGVNVESKGEYLVVHAFSGSQNGTNSVRIKENAKWLDAEILAREIAKRLRGPLRGPH